METNNNPIFFGLTSFRNQKTKFGIKHDDRRRHFYTIGKTGMGKSNLMENMAIQDIQSGHGLAYVDPHGEGAEKLLDFVPENRIEDVIFFNPSDLDFPLAFNVMEKVDFRYRHLVAGGLMAVFKKVWPDVWSARMEYILNNTILALLEYPDSTLLGINRMLSDVDYRAKVVAMVKDPIVKSFWTTEYSRYSQKYEIEATAAIQNKVGQFVSNALIRNIVGQTNSTIDMRKIMDEQKILIIDLSKGRIGEDNSRLLGALLITKLQLAAMSRVDIPEQERKDFYLYVDEFQNFATESFASILSEARKYRLCLIVGHQYISQMDEIVRDAVFGNVGTMAVFRVGAEDAEFLEKEFSPEFTAEDLVNLTKYNIYLKLMIDGVASHPFSAHTLPPPPPLETSYRTEIIQSSRKQYSVPRDKVETDISLWTSSQHGGEGNKVNTSSASKPAPLGGENQTTLYDAICSSCGKPTKTIFKPEAGRAIYCKSCLKKRKAAQELEKQGVLGKQGEQGKQGKSSSGMGLPKDSKIVQVPSSSSQEKQSTSSSSNTSPEVKEPSFVLKKETDFVLTPNTLVTPQASLQSIENENPPKVSVLPPPPPPTTPPQTSSQSSSPVIQQSKEEKKIEEISFHRAKTPGKISSGEKKEVNLSELRKAIADSLKDQPESESESEDEGEEEDDIRDAQEEALIEGSLEVEKTSSPLPVTQDPPSPDSSSKKGILNPGEKVNLE